jgi:hypothetical protein
MTSTLLLAPIGLSVPGPFEMLLILLVFGTPIVVIFIAIAVLRSRGAGRIGGPGGPQGFPMVPAAEADGPGTYQVCGVDKETRIDKEIVVEAASRANAQVKAELEGIVVTRVTKQS